MNLKYFQAELDPRWSASPANAHRARYWPLEVLEKEPFAEPLDAIVWVRFVTARQLPVA